MDTSIMQNALGVFQQDCQKLRYEDNNLVLEIQTPKEKREFNKQVQIYLISS